MTRVHVREWSEMLGDIHAVHDHVQRLYFCELIQRSDEAATTKKKSLGAAPTHACRAYHIGGFQCVDSVLVLLLAAETRLDSNKGPIIRGCGSKVGDLRGGLDTDRSLKVFDV